MIHSTVPDNANDFQHDPDALCINTIRVLSMDTVQQANSGHPGLPLGAAPMAYALWTRHLRHNPAHPAWPDRDRFILSAGHGSALLYSLLYLTGYDLPLKELKRFRKKNSRTPGHPEYGLTPGVETTTGPLGQGLANGVGMAIAERFLAAHFNQPDYPIVDHSTYVLVGDGDLMEGITAEAASLAGHLGLGKLICLYDQNGISLAGETSLTFTENVMARFAAYGWQVEEVADGNDPSAIDAALQRARADDMHPSLICVRTHIGYGSPHKQDTFEAHGAPLGEEEVQLTRHRLGWPYDEAFYIPEEALAIFRQALKRGAEMETAWQERMQAYRAAYPQLADEYERILAGELPANWESLVPQFAPTNGPMATRKASGKVLAALAENLWNLVGGSADLNPSTNTVLAGRGDFQRPRSDSEQRERPIQGASGGEWGWGGQNVHFGVREHAMGAVLNGMAVHGGIIAYGATFLVFSDYMRPPIRLAAIMELGVKYVFTHDSIAVGEDGPTHQPVEHLASLRAMPGLVVIRPADANETAWAWKAALSENKRPVALVLSRQDLPVFDRTAPGVGPAEGITRGAYILMEAQGEAAVAPDLVLISSGSEVALCLEARERLAAYGIRTRVVSMASWELFDDQSEDYHTAVLGPTNTPRLAVEASVFHGWCRYIGDRGAILGIKRFGISAPGKDVLRHYGFTVENVVTRALALLQRDQEVIVSETIIPQETGHESWH